MSDLTNAAAELMEAFQEVSESTPKLSYNGEEAEIMPAPVGNNPMYVPGGTADGSQFDVCTYVDAWNTIPPDMAVVSLSGHASADDKDYQVLNRQFLESWLVFTLGNADAR